MMSVWQEPIPVTRFVRTQKVDTHVTVTRGMRCHSSLVCVKVNWPGCNLKDWWINKLKVIVNNHIVNFIIYKPMLFYIRKTRKTRRRVFIYMFNVLKCLIDADECLVDNGGCGHVCTDGIGQYSCSCYTGYTLEANQATCVGMSYTFLCINLIYNLINITSRILWWTL